MTDDGKQVLFDTPENVEALQFWLDLQNKYQIMAPGIVQWTDLPTQFLAGEVAMIYHTTGNMANINENAEFEFGAAFLPGNKRVAAPTGGGNFYISNGISEERVQAAWEFIKFATDTERAAQWSLDTGYVATRESCFETDLIKNYYQSSLRSDSLFSAGAYHLQCCRDLACAERQHPVCCGWGCYAPGGADSSPGAGHGDSCRVSVMA